MVAKREPIRELQPGRKMEMRMVNTAAPRAGMKIFIPIFLKLRTCSSLLAASRLPRRTILRPAGMQMMATMMPLTMGGSHCPKATTTPSRVQNRPVGR